MKNYKMIITYDGTRYYGWEHQPTTDMTIQGKLESVLSAMTGTEVEVIGAGRTDAGVHAKGMVANAHMETKMKEDEICDYMNRYLPEDRHNPIHSYTYITVSEHCVNISYHQYR